eukprot:TRINITY_DN71957_c0_g1_i1.p1 TRINITY_DN71957_c0_g1~~TRINITY_DN71957_c0_g1_i1.p1  ORF type:complete len:127 (+),score=14.64 TRINITY_DN71957_c0_g1_i1:296-676(+)
MATKSQTLARAYLARLLGSVVVGVVFAVVMFIALPPDPLNKDLNEYAVVKFTGVGALLSFCAAIICAMAFLHQKCCVCSPRAATGSHVPLEEEDEELGVVESETVAAPPTEHTDPCDNKGELLRAA